MSTVIARCQLKCVLWDTHSRFYSFATTKRGTGGAWELWNSPVSERNQGYRTN